MISCDGPLGPGRLSLLFENKRLYFRSTKALWNLSRVEGLRITAVMNRLRAEMKRDSPPRINRSLVLRFGALFLVRSSTMSWCLSRKFSAMTLLAPPGLSKLAATTNSPCTGSTAYFPHLATRVRSLSALGLCAVADHGRLEISNIE